MAKTLTEISNEILRRLGDEAEDVWTLAEIQAYLIEGYDLLAIMSKWFWDRSELDDVAGQALYTLPEEAYQVERATWNHEKIAAVNAFDLISLDSQYMTTGGRVEAYSIDMDGINQLRKYRIPLVSTNNETTQWGIPRDLDVTGAIESTSWGLPRSVAGLDEGSQPWGIIRAGLTGGENNMIIEYYRRGLPVNVGSDSFEFPDYAVKYIRHFGMAQALDRESPGQDEALASHYLSRFHDGAKRVIDRKIRVESLAPRQFGGNANQRRRPTGPVWGPEFPVRD